MTTHVSAGSATARQAAVAVVAAFVAAGVVCTVISLVARGLGADASKVMGLNPPLYLLFTLVGLSVAAVVWSQVRSRAQHPARVMRILVPVVVVVSLLPDLGVGLAGFGWTGAVALMAMHLSVAACGVAAFSRLLPLPR